MGPPSHQVVPERKKKKWKKDKEKKYRRNYLERKLLLSHPWGASRFRENYFSPSKIFQDENKNYRLQQNHSPRTYFSHLRKIISTFPRVLLSEIYIYICIFASQGDFSWMKFRRVEEKCSVGTRVGRPSKIVSLGNASGFLCQHGSLDVWVTIRRGHRETRPSIIFPSYFLSNFTNVKVNQAKRPVTLGRLDRSCRFTMDRSMGSRDRYRAEQGYFLIFVLHAWMHGRIGAIKSRRFAFVSRMLFLRRLIILHRMER